LLPLFNTDRRYTDADRRRVKGIGAQPRLVEGFDDRWYVGPIEGRDEDAVPLRLGHPEAVDRDQVPLARDPNRLDQPDADRAGPDAAERLGKEPDRFLHP